jgi:hypothetical protein
MEPATILNQSLPITSLDTRLSTQSVYCVIHRWE